MLTAGAIIELENLQNSYKYSSDMLRPTSGTLLPTDFIYISKLFLNLSMSSEN